MLPEIKRILYATDLSKGAPQVFRYALKLAKEHQGQITIVNVLEPLGAFAQSLVELHVAHDQVEKMHANTKEHVRKDIELRLSELCKEEQCKTPDGRDLVSEIRVIDGQPAEAILATATDIRADLIVLGSHGHSTLSDALLGGTANMVLHRSEVPVLLVKMTGGNIT